MKRKGRGIEEVEREEGGRETKGRGRGRWKG